MKFHKLTIFSTFLASFSILISGCNHSGEVEHTHTFSDEWSTNETHHWHDSTCGHDVVKDKGEHVFSDWSVITPATTTTEGEKARRCEICAYEQKEIIPIIIDNLELSSYTVSYLEDDKEATYAAKELFSVLKEDVKGISTVATFDLTKTNIYLKTSDELSSKYKIEHNDKAFVLTSDTAVGLIEAARDFINTTTSETKLENWYKTPLTSEYTILEKATMMSYNVRVADDGTLANGDSGNVANRLPRVAKNILTFMPDTVGVQEASDRWISGLKEKLMPQYGYVGFGRESNYTGESTGIFYNKDKVNLIEGHTYWFSDTPEVAGSHFDDYGGYNRIMTYGIFERISDGYRYIHANTHLDLKQVPNQKDAVKCDELLSPYKDKLPIFVTGDYNCTADADDWAYDEFVNNRNYIDSKYETLDANIEQNTFPQDGYYNTETKEIIDFCLKANSGLHFTKYLVDTNKYSGDGVEVPQLTSDHYPLYLEAIPYDPLVSFNNDIEEKDVSIDNGFALHNHNFGLVRNESKYANVKSVLAYKSDTNGDLIDKKLNLTNHFAINPNVTDGYVEYKFNSEDNGLADLNVVMANSLSSPSGTKDLSQYITVTLNSEDINVENLNLRCSDIRSEMYEWENLVIKDATIKNGENTLRIATKNSEAPYQLLLEIFSDIEVTPNESDDGETSYYYFKLGTEQITIKRFNKTFENQRASIEVVDGEQYLTIELLNNEETVLKMADGSDLDASLDFTNYKKVTITGAGTLTVQYTNLFDGIGCNDLTIENGVTLNLTGASTTNKTGIKAYGILQIDGTLNIKNFGYGLALTNEKDVELQINVGTSGQLNVTDCTWGVYGWNKPASHNASINLAGDTNISTSKSPFMILKESIHINVTGTANVFFNSSAAVGIYSYGNVYVRDNATLNINSAGGGIYGTKTIMVANGTADDPIQNNASLNVVCQGNKASTGKDNTTEGLSKDGNMIQSGGTGTINMIFVTLGTVHIECTNTGKTGIQFTSSATNVQHRIIIKCSDMTIKNANNAIGCWISNTNVQLTSTYDYNEPYAKLKLVSCTNICNSPTSYNASRFAPFLESGAVERL